MCLFLIELSDASIASKTSNLMPVWGLGAPLAPRDFWVFLSSQDTILGSRLSALVVESKLMVLVDNLRKKILDYSSLFMLFQKHHKCTVSNVECYPSHVSFVCKKYISVMTGGIHES